MRMIEEYALDTGANAIAIPKGAQLMNVGVRGTYACLWMLIDTEQLDELRHFTVYRTGVQLPEDFEVSQPRMAIEGEWHVGSVLCGRSTDPLNLVGWHVFERCA
jgi:hypothetical protein